MKPSKPSTRTPEILTIKEVRDEIEQAILAAGGLNALARDLGINPEPIIRARKPNGKIRPIVLLKLGLRKREDTYERIGGKRK